MGCRQVFLVALGATLALAQSGPFRQALPDVTFQNCRDVLNRALDVGAEIQNVAYVMELFPASQGSLDTPFVSEGAGAEAAKWLASHDPKSYTYAVFYFASGAYSMRCRDNGGRYQEFSGPSGRTGPLDLKLASGRARIWNFEFSPVGFADVLVVTDLPLTEVDGPALRAEVAKLLGAPRVSLYVRNAPWFVGVAWNALTFLFTDSFKKPTEEEIRSSKVLWCFMAPQCEIRRIF